MLLLNTAQALFVAEVWRNRAHHERIATQRYVRLGKQAQACGLGEEITSALFTAAKQEEQHALLCEETSQRWRAGLASLPWEQEAPLAPAEWSKRAQLAYELVAVNCLAETTNATLLGVTLEQTEEREMRETLRVLLRDEVQHARLGWLFVQTCLREEEARLIEENLVKMLSLAFQTGFFEARSALVLDRELRSVGVLSMEERRALVVGTLEQVFFPGLERAGISTAKARGWLLSKTDRATMRNATQSGLGVDCGN